MTESSHGSIYRDLPDATPSERFEELCRSRSFRVERITSCGQASPRAFFYDQAWEEWILILQGWATVQMQEPEQTLHLNAGDWLMITAHQKHRVVATSQTPATIWLAIHGNSGA